MTKGWKPYASFAVRNFEMKTVESLTVWHFKKWDPPRAISSIPITRIGWWYFIAKFWNSDPWFWIVLLYIEIGVDIVTMSR